jgi:hypothetical protein
MRSGLEIMVNVQLHIIAFVRAVFEEISPKMIFHPRDGFRCSFPFLTGKIVIDEGVNKCFIKTVVAKTSL